MCQSRAHGGQRCPSGARTALDTAQTKRDALVQQALAHTARGEAIPEALVRSGMEADDKLDDALTVYASTPEGEADLRARMQNAPRHSRNHAEKTRGDLDDAIRDGLVLRARNARIKAAVKAGTMSKAQAEIESEYPEPGANQWRENRIQAAVARQQMLAARGLAPIAPAVTASPAAPTRDAHEELSNLIASGTLSERAMAVVSERVAYNADYDRFARMALSEDGRATLEARLAELPAVPRGGYHQVTAHDPAATTPAHREAYAIAEALDDAHLNRGLVATEIPTESARQHRASTILAAVAALKD